jgi:molybdate transport system permease protein
MTLARDRARARPPVVFVVGAALAALLFAIPLLGLVWRAPWSSAWGVLGEEQTRKALRLSIETS